MEGYDGVMVLAQAMEAAGTTDSDAVEEALRALNWDGTRGTITFDQSTDPAWKHQQWLGVPIFVIQYDEANQTPSDSKILWPREQATTEEIVLKP